VTDGPRTLVTGASGFLGRLLVRRLADEGRPVRVLERRPSDAWDGLDVERVQGDVTDPGSLARASEGVSRVFNLAGVVSHLDRDAAVLHRVNVAGVDNVLGAARAAGVERVVHVSSVAAVGPAPDAEHPADESSAFPEFANRYAYPRTKRLGEERAMAAAAAGQDVVIACPGFVIGAGDVNRISTFTIEQYLRGTLRFTIPGGLSYVDARDVVEGLLLLEGKGARGERYILTSEDGNLSHRDFFDLVGEVAGKKRLTVPLPPALLVPGARLLTNLRVPLPVKPDELASSRHYWFARADRARRDLGFTSRPVREAIAATVDWYGQNGTRGRPA
jgi:dihydroflavonol-4-reductase